MLRLRRAELKWWQKPLAAARDRVLSAEFRVLPAELAVLEAEVKKDETGVWLNSPGLKTGVSNLIALKEANTKFRTDRVEIPSHVASRLRKVYQEAHLAKGCPDLVIWRTDSDAFRLVEVKRRHLDFLNDAQRAFMKEAARQGVESTVVEWEFENSEDL